MQKIVQKFGGTSVGTIEKIKHVCSIINKEIKNGNQVAVVSSAMSGETNKLLSLAENFDIQNNKLESDMIVSTGEQIAISLISMALKEIGLKGRPLLGWQIPIIGTKDFTKAKINRIDDKIILEIMNRGEIPIIAGFQGIDEDKNIVTFGRGGSDTSAVAIAAAIAADRCDIYTDVDGVYTTDPRIVKNARKLNKISYEEMLEFASLGAKVLQTRSVEMAMRHEVTVQVLSSISGNTGTFLIKEDEKMENELVSGIAYSKDEANLTLINILDKPGVATKIFSPLGEANINVDMIVQTGSENGNNINFTYTVSRKDLEQTILIMEENKNDIGFERIIRNNSLAKVSIIGLGMRTHTGVANKMFSALASENINIHVISTSEIKISVLIDETAIEKAINVLHSTFELEKK
ncbi:MAG: aspartate kinase [Pelagibacterales bacterium]|nr:aspartate kinase [Pelagibacterales bacterium]PPR17204.1 MAG: Aspartate kinase [Alphaproteobacteria bacterium MarineAlpha9_Bin3]|tara:strand:+ start:6445 stop:7665 length:1221 start_codon:yes stop_codon:yes gene_type:complete